MTISQSSPQSTILRTDIPCPPQYSFLLQRYHTYLFQHVYQISRKKTSNEARKHTHIVSSNVVHHELRRISVVALTTLNFDPCSWICYKQSIPMIKQNTFLFSLPISLLTQFFIFCFLKIFVLRKKSIKQILWINIRGSNWVDWSVRRNMHTSFSSIFIYLMILSLIFS